MTILDHALQAANRGWHVFRLNIGHNEDTCDGGTTNCKNVRFLDNWKTRATNDPNIITTWDWQPANAYGIACGPSGLLIVDVDPGATWPHPANLVCTSGRGTHYYYEDLIGQRNRTNVPPHGIDIRGVGGIIIGPGSYHPHGTYAILQDGDPALPPPEVYETHTTNTDNTDNTDTLPTLDPLDALNRLEGVYRRMANTPEGQRNDMLNKLAVTAAGLHARLDPADQTGELHENTIRQRLLDAVPNDDDPYGSQRTIDSGWAYGTEHPTADRSFELAARRIFNATETLRHIEQAAHSIGRGAMPMLCFTLARVLAETPPTLMLPGGQDGAIGSRAALNLGFALTGRSGAGKTDISETSEDLLGIDQSNIQRTPSSGEGLIQSYLVRGDDRTWRTIDDPRRLFNVDEIEQLSQVAGRTGATIGAILRTMLTGGQIGTENADLDRRRNLRRGTYRMILTAGVQPALSGALLNEQRSGLPQRFLWTWVVDSTVPHPDDRPDWPGPLNWALPPIDLMDEQIIDYPDYIKREIRLADWNRSKDDSDDDTSHLYLTRLKVAAALALLHGEVEITNRWWGIAGDMIEASEAVQAKCREVLADEQHRASVAVEIARRKADESADEDQLTRATRAVLRNIQRFTDRGEEPPFSWSKVKPAYRLSWDGWAADIADEVRRLGGRVDEREARNGGLAYDFYG